MKNTPKIKIGIVAVSRDCFPESLSVTRRKNLVRAYKAKYDETEIYECPVCIVESEIHMLQALEDIILGRRLPRPCLRSSLTVRKCL